MSETLRFIVIEPPQYLYCHSCGKCVSTGFYAIPTEDTPDGEIIVRAYIQCPECIEKGIVDASNAVSNRTLRLDS